MSHQGTIELLSSSDEEQEEKKSDSEAGSKMGNCISGPHKRKRSPTSLSTSSSPGHCSGPKNAIPSHPATSASAAAMPAPLSPKRRANAQPQTLLVPDIVDQRGESPPPGRRDFYVIGRDGRIDAANCRDRNASSSSSSPPSSPPRRDSALHSERSFFPPFLPSESSSSSNSSSSSSFFSSVNCSHAAVRAPPPKYRKGTPPPSTSTTADDSSLGSFSNCPSSVAVRGETLSFAARRHIDGVKPLPSRWRHQHQRQQRQRQQHVTIDLTVGEGQNSEGNTEGDGSGGGEDEEASGWGSFGKRDSRRNDDARGGKKRHRFCESAGMSAVTAGVDIAISDSGYELEAIKEDGGSHVSVKKPPKRHSVSLGGGSALSTNSDSVSCDGEDEPDVAVVTEGLMDLIDGVGIPNVATCTRTSRSYADAAEVSSALAIPRPSPRLPLHYQQRDKWSCGFRNLQMMLSALLPLMQADHPFFEMTVGDGSRKRRGSCGGSGGLGRSVPSLYGLQVLLEQSWADGFDPRGARHFDHRIRGRTGRSSWIGAVEVCSVLSYLSVDSVVVQFIQHQGSRELLGDFVRSYFERKAGFDGCYMCCASMPSRAASTSSITALSSTQISSELLQFATMRRNAGDGHVDVSVECCDCPIPPLYLQWEGHSVTVVGCSERRPPKNGAASDEQGPAYDLLVFDPMRSGFVIKEKLQAAKEKQAMLGTCVNVGNRDIFPTADLQGVILSTNELLRLDCQIVLSSPRPLSCNERMKCRTKVSALTAEGKGS